MIKIIITKITTNNYQNSNNNKKKSSPFIQKSLSSKRLQSVITIVVITYTKCSIGRTKFPEISDIKKCEKVLLPAGKSKNIYIKWKELIT